MSRVLLAHPGFITQDKSWRRPRFVIRRLGGAAEHRFHSKKLKNIRGNCRALEALGAFSGGVKTVFLSIRDGIFKYVVLADVIKEFRTGKRHPPAGVAIAQIVDLYGH